MAITLLNALLPLNQAAIFSAFKNVSLPGRIQFYPGPVTEIYDVSHNPASVAFLAEKLRRLPHGGKTHAVFSMLSDKDRVGSIKTIQSLVDAWYLAPLKIKRATSADTLVQSFHEADISAITLFKDINTAYRAAKQQATAGDRIIIFGSFHTVAQGLTARARLQP